MTQLDELIANLRADVACTDCDWHGTVAQTVAGICPECAGDVEPAEDDED
jgi:Zn finger protein HypA/HybF involved in hydrogenase expression